MKRVEDLREQNTLRIFKGEETTEADMLAESVDLFDEHFLNKALETEEKNIENTDEAEDNSSEDVQS